MSGMKWTQAMDGSPSEVTLGCLLTVERLDRGYAMPGDDGNLVDWPDWGTIRWQHGPIQEVGRNGILLEELLEFVVIPRLEGFNRPRIAYAVGADPNDVARLTSVPLEGEGPWVLEPGFHVAWKDNPFRNRETSLAITHLEEALHWLKRRTELRQRQGVEGTFRAHRS